jgi:hypothetical protein
VAKAQYLKQLARRVDDVKFVGIAVPGDEVEKQEVLAQIFVMPDVREERSKQYVTRDSTQIFKLSLSLFITLQTKLTIIQNRYNAMHLYRSKKRGQCAIDRLHVFPHLKF